MEPSLRAPVNSLACASGRSCSTHQGDLVLVTLEGDHPETAFAEFGKRTDPFTVWFKQQVSEIHGMDLGAPPPGPMPQQVIDSHS